MDIAEIDLEERTEKVNLMKNPRGMNSGHTTNFKMTI